MKLVLPAVMTIAGCAASIESETVVYDTRFGDTTAMDIYQPDDGAARHPTVMYIHGGSWRFGDKRAGETTGQRLAASGFVVASINYRLLPDGVFPNNIEDCICALAFLRSNADVYGIDPDRIAVMGYSAGAHLASLVGLAAEHPELAPDCDAAAGQTVARPAAVIAASGPLDMVEFWTNSNDKSGVEPIFGGSPAELPHAYELGSPSWHVAPGAPPHLLMQDAVEFGGIAATRDKLLAAGNDVRMLQIEGSLHIFEQHDDAGFYEAGVASETPEAWLAIEDFLFRTIAKDGAR